MNSGGSSDALRPVLVTGGAGFIGSHLVERLLGDGHAVVVVDDLSTGDLGNLRAVSGDSRLKVIRSKLSACCELERIVAGASSIYHLAAAVGVELVVRSPIHTLETNLHETEVLLRAAAAHRVPVLVASSSEVYGKSERPQFSEDDDLLIGPPDHIRWGYACSKLMDEFLTLAYAQEKALPAVVARLFNTVGPRQTGKHGMVLPRFIAAARNGEPLTIFGDGSQKRCFCYITDTVEALVRLQNDPACRGRVFNVGTTEEISILDLAKTVIAILRSRSELRFVPQQKADARGGEDIRQRKPSVERLASATGFRPATPLSEIILRTAESMG